MKEMSNITKTSVMVPRWYRGKSRIISIKPVLTMLALLMVALFGVNESAWAKQTTKATVTIISGKGTVSLKAQYKPNVWTTTDGATGSISTVSTASNIGKEYSVSYDRGNTQDGSVVFEATAGTGYTFYGWCTKSDCSDTPDTSNPLTISKGSWKTIDETRYTKFTPNTYTVKFDKNGGTHGSTASVGATYDQNVTLTTNGFWRAKYVVRYDANGGTCATTADTAYYSFEGWATTSAGAKAYNDGATLTKPNFVSTQGGEKTLFAKWGSGTTSVILPTPSAAPVYDGSGSYSFAGWYLSTDEATKTVVGIGGGSYTPTANVTLKAKWTLTKQPGFSGADQNMSVGAGYTGFVFSNTTTATPSANPSDKFYYVISNVNVTSANTDGSADPNKVIAVETAGGTTTIRAINKGTAKITFYQQADATNNIAVGNSTTYTFTVDKIANTISCNWDGWSKSNIRFDEEISTILSSTNSDGYASLTVTPTAGTNVARYDGANNKVVALCDEGTATWSISQAEDYKYYAATTKTLSVTVAKATPSCYLLEVPGEEGAKLGNEMHEHTWTENNVAGVLSFEVRKGDNTSVGVNVEIQEYVNGRWSKVNDYGGSITTSYTTKTDALSQGATGIKFKSAGSYKNYVQNITITRVNWIKLVNAGGSEISSITLPSRTRTGAASTGTFYIDYSTCAGTIKLVSNNEHVKFSANNSTKYTFDAANGTRKTIGVTYTSGDAESIAATITVYTPYDRKTLTVNAQTMSKLTTTLEYKGADSYAVDHANMNATDLFQVRDQNGALVASPAITLSSSNTDAINTVSSNTAIDFLCGANNVRITASYAGDETYAAASNSGTFYHDIDVIKLSDAIVWSNVAEDGKIHVWAESDIPNTIASANEAIDAYTSSNSANVRVSGSKGTFALRARRPGEITLTAHSEGSCTYSTAEDTKTIMVDSCAQDIIWEQNLAGLSTEEDGTISRRITLNAYAVDSNNVETGRVITYSLPANTSFASIENGNELVLTGTGSVVLTASTASDDTIYAQAQASKLVRVRVYGTGCGSEIVDKDQHAVGAYNNNKGKQYGDVNPLPPIDKIYVRVGKYSDVATQTLYIYGYNASGTETTLASYGVGNLTTSGDDKELSNISEDICRIKIKAGGTISKWYSDLRITQKSYLRKSVENISNDHLFVFENVNETIRVSYSDKPLLQYRYTGSNLTLTPTETVNNDCGGYGYYDFVLSGSYSRMGDYHDTIYITTTALDTLRVPVYHRVSTGGSLLFNEADGNWSESGKWSNDMLPRRENDVIISKNVIVTGEVEAYSVTLVSGGSITIMPGSGLTVGAGGITGSTTSNLILKAGTEGATKGQTGYLRISPEYASTMPNATVELYSTAYHNKNAESGSKSRYQCVGAPISDAGVRANTVYPAGTWLYTWNESTETWTNSRSSYTFVPFQGFETTQKKDVDGLGFNYEGHLVSGHDVVTIDLAYTSSEKGYNLLANSWAAPISIEEFKTGDFIDAERTVYILNAGTKNESDAPAEGLDAPGKWVGVPLNTASALAAAGYPCVIPSMQGFWVKANGASAQLKLDYSRLVWGVDYSGTRINKPLRAPERNAELDEEEMPITGQMMISVSSEQEGDVVFMLESERFETVYENGNDAYKIASESLDIYTVEDGDKLSVDATSSIDGTQLGIHTNEETAFTLSFSHVSEEKWALYDMYTNEKIDIYNGTTYTFFSEPNAEINGRFMIVERAEVPGVATGCDNVSEGAKAHKFVKDDQMYILKNGVLYNVMGTVVK